MEDDKSYLFDQFINIVNSDYLDYTIVELGTKRSNEDIKTMCDEKFSNYKQYIGVDIEDGIDVDIVLDAHKLSNKIQESSIDVLIARSVFEHIKYPWIAVKEMAKVLKPNGIIFVQTHQSFCTWISK